MEHIIVGVEHSRRLGLLTNMRLAFKNLLGKNCLFLLTLLANIRLDQKINKKLAIVFQASPTLVSLAKWSTFRCSTLLVGPRGRIFSWVRPFCE